MILEGVFQQIPVQLPLFVPLPEMPQLVAHKVQLFARVRIHIKIKGAQLVAFFFLGTPKLVDDGLFAVDDLVVAQRQQVKLVVEIVHTENDLPVCVGPLAEGGVVFSMIFHARMDSSFISIQLLFCTRFYMRTLLP